MRLNHRQFSLLFFGSDAFSVRILKHLIDRSICPIEVVTRSGTILDHYSAECRLKRYRWPLIVDGEQEFNIGLVASFGNLIDKYTVNRFHYGLFNVHPSLLPQYRGSTPIQAAIRDNLEETGCSLMRIPPIDKFDIGEILLQKKLAIKRREYAIELRDRLADMGCEMVEDLLLNYDKCIQNIEPQSEMGKSYAKKLKLEDGFLNFTSESSSMIDRKVRAYSGFIDLYSFCLGGLKIRLLNLRDPEETKSYDLDRLSLSLWQRKGLISGAENSPQEVPAGSMFFHKIRQTLCIKCSDSNWLSFDRVRPEDKSEMSSLEFYNGYLSKVNIINRRVDD